MFIVSNACVNKHVGEEYDVIIEVADEPTTENIDTDAGKVMEQIRELWKSQDDDKPRDKVVVFLDAAPPFAAMLINLQIIMKAEEGIIIELPWDKPVNLEELDAESKEVLKKLEQK
jgi:hypothetical protein